MSDEKHPLELKFEEVARKPPVRQRETSEILNEIVTHEGMMKLFHLMENSPKLGRIFFLHPLDLFGRKGRYQPPYLYYGKCTADKTKKSYVSRALEALQIDYKVRASLGLSTMLEQIGISADEQESLGRDLADAIVYALVVLFRISPTLRELVQSDEFNYNKLRALVKDYSEIIDTEELEKTLTSVFSDTSEDPELMHLIERLILGLVPLATRGSIEFLEMTKISQSEIAIAYHQAALSFLDTLLKKASLSLNEYSELLSQLYLYGLIENGHTIFWCENCSKERISYYEFHGPMAPSKMLGRKCRDCNHAESFSSVFKVDSLLLEAIFSRDHLLSVYLAWKLKEMNLNPELNVFVGDLEIDAIVNHTVIECKTFRIGGRDETSRENLEQTLLQIRKQMEALTASSRSIKGAVILWNLPSTRKLLSEVSGKTNKIIEQYNVRLFSHESIDELIESLGS